MAISSVKEALTNDSKIKEKLDNFRNSSKTLFKSDLQNIKENKSRNSTALGEVIGNYDKIDINGDGLSLSELQTYYTAKGTLSSSINNTSNSFWQEYFDNTSSNSSSEIKSFWQTDDDSEDKDSEDYYSDFTSNISTGITKKSLAGTISSITNSGNDVPEGLKKLAEDFDKVDEDQDGTISLAEYQKFAKDNKIQADGSFDSSKD